MTLKYCSSVFTVLQTLPKGRAVLRVRMPGPAGRGHAISRAAAPARAHPVRELLRDAPGALPAARGRLLPSSRGCREDGLRRNVADTPASLLHQFRHGLQLAFN